MKLKLASIISGLIFIFSLSYCRDSNQLSEEDIYLNHSDTVSYIGIEACKACHADKYETFTQTGMGLSFDTASILKSSAHFQNVVPVYDSFNNLYYLPFLRQSVFFLKEYRMYGTDTIYSRTEKIKYIIGSGHHTNSHMIDENGYVFQAPITFYTQKGKWDLPPGYENGNNTRFNRKIGLECMSCHNAIPELIVGSENKYIDLPHGIDCERCHGPGSLHVKEMQKGKGIDVSKYIDYTIVNPSKLTWQRQIDVCQRCHLQGNAVLKPNKKFTDFKPGMRLSEVFDQFSPEYEGGDHFVMAAHAERFQQSKCFILSVKGNIQSKTANIGFTCISCHNPHVSVKQTNHKQFNQTCAKCHPKESKPCSENIKELNNNNNDCVFCHMPSSGTSDIPHVTVHDHFIRKPVKLSINEGRRLLGLRCITSDKSDIQTETEAYISYFEKFDTNPLFIEKAKEKSKQLDAKKQNHFQTLVHLYYVTENYYEILVLEEKYKHVYDAWTYYRFAKAFEHYNKNEKANFYYLKILNTESNNLDFILQYAVFQIKIGQFKKAELQLNHYLKLYDKTAEVWSYLGIVKLKNTEMSSAKKCFLKALALDPDQILALNNLKSLYHLIGDSKKEKEINLRLLTLQSRKK